MNSLIRIKIWKRSLSDLLNLYWTTFTTCFYRSKLNLWSSVLFVYDQVVVGQHKAKSGDSFHVVIHQLFLHAKYLNTWTHLFPMHPFCKPSGFLFSWGRERVHWERIGDHLTIQISWLWLCLGISKGQGQCVFGFTTFSASFMKVFLFV